MGNSLVVQWLGLHAFTAEGPGSIPGWGTKIPQAMRRGPKKNNEKDDITMDPVDIKKIIRDF